MNHIEPKLTNSEPRSLEKKIIIDKNIKPKQSRIWIFIILGLFYIVTNVLLHIDIHYKLCNINNRVEVIKDEQLKRTQYVYEVGSSHLEKQAFLTWIHDFERANPSLIIPKGR